MFARRRRHQWWIAVLVGLLVTIGLAALAAWITPIVWDSPARQLATGVNGDPSLPVVVPTELPAEYRFLGRGRTVHGPDERDVLAVAWVYAPRPGFDEWPVVELCVAHGDVDLTGMCVPTEDHELTRTVVDDLQVAVVALGSRGREDAAGAWAGRELTSDWERADWVHRRTWR